MTPLTLSQRLFVVTAFALLPALAIVAANILTLQKSTTTELHAAALSAGKLAALEIERTLTGTENVLRVVTAAPVVRQGDRALCSDFLQRVVASLPYLASIAVINVDGTVRCLPDYPVDTLYLGDRPYFAESLKTPGRVTGQFTVGRLTGRFVLPIAIRFGNADMPGGVAVAYIDLNWLQSTIEERPLANGSSLTIADRDGRILAREPDPKEFVGTLIPQAFQRLVHAEAPGTEELTSQDGTRRVIGYVPISGTPPGIYVSAGISTKAAFQTLSDVAVLGIIISILGTLAAFLLAQYTSRRFVIEPLEQLLGTIEHWRQGQTDVRTNMPAESGEFGRAGRALDAFMDELVATRVARQQAEEQRQLLAEELNHRVKNMLQLIQVVAAQTFAGAGANAAVTIFRSRLSAIADANAVLFQNAWQSADVRDVVTHAVAPFVNPDANPFTLDGPPLRMSSGAVLALGMALHELCTNAVKYGALSVPAGRVSLSWTVETLEGQAQFSLTWKEQGGPAVQPPARTGFGSKVIQQVLASKIGGEVTLTYGTDGLVCLVTAPLARLQENEADAA